VFESAEFGDRPAALERYDRTAAGFAPPGAARV
jgi:hypothetical protein